MVTQGIQMTDEGWEEQKSIQLKLQNPGDEIIGVLLKKERQVKYGVMWYTIESQTDEVGLLGSMQLDRLMAKAEPGDLVKIRLLGFEDVPNGKLKMYQVWLNHVQKKSK